MDILNTLNTFAPPVLQGLARTFKELFLSPASASKGTPADTRAPENVAIAAEPGTADTPAYAENAGNITVDGTDDGTLFDYFKADLSSVESRYNRTLSAFAMASLKADPHGDTYREAGDYAVLTNDGEIHMNMGELLRRYGPEMTAPGDMEDLPGGKKGIREGSGKKYMFLMLWGMLGGNQSCLVNNGKIVIECDTDNPEGTENVFTHPMYVYHRSAMINNGEVRVCGKGNRGINPRGLTSQKNDLTIINNGSIVIDVEKAYITRALTVAGAGSTLINRGLVRGQSGGTVFGAGHTGSSTLVNEGTVEVTTMGVLPTERMGVLSTFASRTGAYGLSAAGPDYMMETLHENFKSGVQNWKGGGIVNAGVVKAAVRDTGAADANSTAAGILLLDSHAPYKGWYTVKNIGIIRAASDVRPCEANHFCVKRAELVLNCVHMPEETVPARVRVKEWATELRNFGTCGDLFQAKSDSNGPVTLNFEDAELILRPPEKYEEGTAFPVSADTLVSPLDAPTLEEANVQVTGVEYLRFRAEMPDFIAPSVQETAKGAYQVSLKLADSPKAQRQMLSSAVMAPVDFMRANLEELDRLTGETETPDWSGAAYQSRHSRKDGLSGQIQGCVAGKDIAAGPLFRVGVHGAFASDRASGGLYHAKSALDASMKGAHISLAGGVLRAQATAFTTSGGTDFSLHTDTGICLDGRSDANLSGLYASAHFRKQLRLGTERKLYAETGVSCLKFHQGVGVDWRFKDEPLPGYRMDSNALNSVRGMLRVGWNRLFRGGRDGWASFSLESSLALSGNAAGLRMLNAAFKGAVREDPIQISLNASIQRRIAGWKLCAGLHGSFAKNNRRAKFHFSFRPEK
ncbi:MAG: hypothetical protein IJR54_05330 [Oscillibacter sp.]|nr:hypothetical protein [Oscillibacter sp.]